MILFSSVIVGNSFSQKNVLVNKWQDKPVVIDGQHSEFGDLPRFYDSKSKVFYEFRNDDKNLYIILNSRDRLAKMKIMSAGIILVVDTVKISKSKNSASLKFPDVFQPKQHPPKKDEGDTQDKPEFKEIVANPEIEISGFNKNSHDADAQFILAGFKIMTEDEISGEIIIPLSFLCSESFLKSENPVFYFSIQINELEMPEGFINGQPGERPDSDNFGETPDMSIKHNDFGDGGTLRQGGGPPPGNGGEMGGGPPQMGSVSDFGKVKIAGKFKLALKND